MSELKSAVNPAKPPEPKKIPRPMPRPNTYMDTKPFWEASGRLPRTASS
jgi:hypothetical protein